MNVAEKLDLRDNKGCIDFDRIIGLMDIEKSDLAAMLDYDRTSLKNNKPATPKMLATLSPYFRILAMLWDNFEGDSAKISKWLHEPKKDWLYLSPIEMMRRKKTDKVVEYLIAHLDKRADIFHG